MKFLNIFSSPWLAVTALCMVGAGSMQAAISACATSAPTKVALTGYSGSGNGCSSVDMSYSNFSVTGGTASGGFVTPTLANTGAFATGTGPLADAISSTLLLSATGAGSWTSNGTNNGALATSTFTYVATANTGGSYPTPSNPALFWGFNQMALDSNVSISNTTSNTNNATITMTICLGSTTVSGCSANLQGQITAFYQGNQAVAYTATCANIAVHCSPTGSNVLTFVGNFTSAAVSTTIAANVGSGGNRGTVNIISISNQFDTIAEAPEPSTFALMGLALSALASLAQKRTWTQR